MIMEDTAFPWLKYLPEEERTRFGCELLGFMEKIAGMSTRQFFEQLDLFVAGWRATAQAYAEGIPEIIANSPEGDYGDVPRPGSETDEQLRARVRDDLLGAYGLDETYAPVHTPKYAMDSVISVRAYPGAGWGRRYHVMDRVMGHYVLKPLSSSPDSFDRVLWAYEDCDEWSKLEWVDDHHRYGLVEQHGKPPRVVLADELRTMGVVTDAD